MSRLEPSDVRQLLLDQQSESDWQQQVLEWAKRGGFRAYHTRDSRRSSAGFPDLVLVSPGRRLLLIAELKRNTGRLTAAQLAWLMDLNKVQRVEGCVWRPNDWEYVKALLLGSPEVGRSRVQVIPRRMCGTLPNPSVAACEPCKCGHHWHEHAYDEPPVGSCAECGCEQFESTASLAGIDPGFRSAEPERGVDPLLIFLRGIADPDNWEHVGESAWRWIGYPPFEQAANLVTEVERLRQREVSCRECGEPVERGDVVFHEECLDPAIIAARAALEQGGQS